VLDFGPTYTFWRTLPRDLVNLSEGARGLKHPKRLTGMFFCLAIHIYMYLADEVGPFAVKLPPLRQSREGWGSLKGRLVTEWLICALYGSSFRKFSPSMTYQRAGQSSRVMKHPASPCAEVSAWSCLSSLRWRQMHDTTWVWICTRKVRWNVHVDCAGNTI